MARFEKFVFVALARRWFRPRRNELASCSSGSSLRLVKAAGESKLEGRTVKGEREHPTRAPPTGTTSALPLSAARCCCCCRSPGRRGLHPARRADHQRRAPKALRPNCVGCWRWCTGMANYHSRWSHICTQLLLPAAPTIGRGNRRSFASAAAAALDPSIYFSILI